MEVKALLEELGLRGWPKTSGSRGMHVNVRIQPRWTFTEVRRAALALSREIERRLPALATSKWWKEERRGVFLDYNQNAKDRTTCSAYSVRPLPDARVSAPLAWDEVPDCDPADFTVLTMPERFAEIGDPHAGMDDAAGSLEALLELAARDEAAGLADAPWPPHFRKMEGEAPRVAPSRAQGSAGEAPQPKMPLIVVANSPDKEAALAGLERWKEKHPEAAKHLAVDDVLVDSMRGRSSTWTRIRVNLRNVPEAHPPPQDTPDPDDDPTREWRENGARRRRAASVPVREDRRQLVRRDHLELGEGAVARPLVVAPAAKLRGVAEAAALHVVVGDLDDQLRTERLPGQVLALAPAARCAGPALSGRVAGCPPRAQSFHGWPSSASSRYGARNSTSSRRFASVKLAHTPTCCRLPDSS